MKIRPGRRLGAAGPDARPTTLLTSPGADRATANRPPKPGPRVYPTGWGELCLHLDAQVAPPPR
jgi:hypothetical protein